MHRTSTVLRSCIARPPLGSSSALDALPTLQGCGAGADPSARQPGLRVYRILLLPHCPPAHRAGDRLAGGSPEPAGSPGQGALARTGSPRQNWSTSPAAASPAGPTVGRPHQSGLPTPRSAHPRTLLTGSVIPGERPGTRTPLPNPDLTRLSVLAASRLGVDRAPGPTPPYATASNAVREAPGLLPFLGPTVASRGFAQAEPAQTHSFGAARPFAGPACEVFSLQARGEKRRPMRTPSLVVGSWLYPVRRRETDDGRSMFHGKPNAPKRGSQGRSDPADLVGTGRPDRR